MSDPLNHAVRELGATRLKLRSDLKFTPQTAGAESFYVVEDPLNARFLRLGREEYAIVSLLDGRTTLQQAFSRLSSVLPHHRLTEQDVAELGRWLVSLDLAHSTESAQPAALVRRANESERGKRLSRWNPIVLRLPIAGPERWFPWLSAALGWLYSTPALCCWMLLVAFGGYAVISDWERFAASSQGMFAANNWLWLAACWCLLKAIHEMSHGIVCTRYGGEVREMGLLLILFMPLAYVDVSSCWRFPSRWRRIHVAAAGMYLELLIAALAALAWSRTESGWLNNLCFNAVVMASLTTLVFNANPLLKLDGYYILSDALAMPNLYSNGQRCLYHWVRRYLLGLPSTLPDWSCGKTAMIGAYGAASLSWRVAVCASLTIAASTLFHGAGVAIACLAVVLWVGPPATKLGKYLLVGKPGESPPRLRLLAILGAATAVGVAVFGFLPWPGLREAPAVVVYAQQTAVRAGSDGFVRRIHVRGGQLVEEGQLLVELENRDLSREQADLVFAILQSEIRGRRLALNEELAALQGELEKREALRVQLEEKRAQVQQLIIRAPRAGKIVRRDLESLMGVFLKQGEEVVSLGDEHRKELKVSVAQEDLDVFSQLIGKTVSVDLPRLPLWESQLTKVIPRATLDPPHPALSVAQGGPLAVRIVEHQTSQGPEEKRELFAPRFTGIVCLSRAHSDRLFAGQVGRVRYRPCHESLGAHLYHGCWRWIDERFRQLASR